MLVPLLVGGAPAALTFIDGVSADIDNGVSHLVPEQLPSFVAADHTQFTEFVKQYYEWMEFEGNPKYESNKLLDYRDVDDTSEYLLNSFFKEFINGLPLEFSSSSTDKRKLIKKIVDLYKAKGTEKSFKSFFRLVFGETPSFFYPANYILKPSTGNWNQPTIIRTTCVQSNQFIDQMAGVKLQQNLGTGGSINASGFIQKAIKRHIDQYEVLELEITQPFGSFRAERDVLINVSGGPVREYIYPVIGQMTVISAGSGYKRGDEIGITTDGSGSNAQFFVSSVGESGNIKTIESYDFGINYRGEDSISATITVGGGSGAFLAATGGSASYQAPGFWEGSSGLASGNNRLQDNSYWQDFSYVIRSSRSLSEYSDPVKKTLHPAGYRLFGEYLITDGQSGEGESARRLRILETPIIGHYTPYRLLTDRNLRANGTGGSGGIDLYSAGYNWEMAIGNTYYDEQDDVAPASPLFLLGNSGPLGGFTHAAESTGTGASEGPGGTANRPQGAQYLVDAGNIGNTASTAGFWEIYPLVTTRDIKELPYSRDIDVARILISPDDDPSGGEADTGFQVGEIVRQIIPKSQQATGKVIAINSINSLRYYDIVTYSGVFLLTGTEVPGGTSGLINGISSGSTGYINSIAADYSSRTEIHTMGSVKVNNFLNSISRAEYAFGSDINTL